ncbi:MAG TPA: hypothetical protein VGR76_22720, partial [Candidatus Angelobacter sp.]|nr:hypothetical protein [Candidatus Angelobacter sp.]
MRKLFLLLILVFTSILPIAQAQPQPTAAMPQESHPAPSPDPGTVTTPHFDGTIWWNYVKVLAGDDMEGRETGSFGLRKAQEYVVEQLKRAGLEPAGSKSYYQPMQFESRQIMEKESSLALVRQGQLEPLTLGDDAIFNTGVNLGPSLEAPLVFAGYGLAIQELNYNDLAGLDLRDKVVVIFSGAP